MSPVLLILESFGTSEFLLILVVALIFFGPRKLPHLSRQIGKSLAEFRKASEDFKRTWEREVALETAHTEPEKRIAYPPDTSVPEMTIGRGQSFEQLPDASVVQPLDSASVVEPAAETQAVESPATPKRDWL